MIYGIAFFGVPHHGLRMKELIAMSEEGPNLGLLTSLSDQNSMVLDILKREFHPVLGDKGQREVVSFYETEMSPTAIKVSSCVLNPFAPMLILFSWKTANGISVDLNSSSSPNRQLRTAETGSLAPSTSSPSMPRTPTWSRSVPLPAIRGRC